MRPGWLDEITEHYRRLLGARFRGLVLYGSRARGDAREDSDVDLFLVADGLPEDPYERASALPSPPHDVRRDPHVSVRAYTPSEYERDISPLDLDIALDGRILHDRDGYIEGRLALVRRRLEEAGLYRDARLAWRWRRPPAVRNWAIGWDGVRV